MKRPLKGNASIIKNVHYRKSISTVQESFSSRANQFEQCNLGWKILDKTGNQCKNNSPSRNLANN